MLAEDALLTVSVVEALAPGLTVKVGVAKEAVQPLGTPACKLKPDAEQLELSLLVTVTVYDTDEPGAVGGLLDGLSATVGLPGAQVGALNRTETVAPALLTDSTVIVTGIAGSV